MCMSPQIKKISVNNSFKNNGKILSQKIISNIDHNKISSSKKLSSRNNEKLNSKNISKKVINSLNKNKNSFIHICSNKNSTNNKNNIKNHFVNYNYDYIIPQTARYNKQYSSSNLFLDKIRNKATFPHNYFKLNQTSNNCNFSLNPINDNNNKITKIEINNINYNNGKNVVIKNLSGTQTTKDSINSNKINKDIIHSIYDNFNNNNNKNSIKFNKNILNDFNKKVIKSLKMDSPHAFSNSRHFSSISSMNLLGENKIINCTNINNIKTPTSNTNFHISSSSNNIFINNNFYTKIQKNYIDKNKNSNKNKNKIKKLNKNLNQLNNNKRNGNNRLIGINLSSNYVNNCSNDKMLLNNTDIKKKNFISNQKVINGINITGINIIKKKNNFTNNKSERNKNAHNKHNKNSLSIKRIDKYSNDVDVEGKKYSFNGNYEKEGLLYKKNTKFKSIYNNYFYDSNKNIFKNISPEENHFKTIIFLQKMKSNNKSII